MKAMILAAGFGTRLKPFTNHKPKALIEINGTPMLELVVSKLIKFGIADIIINVHHFAEMICDFLKSKDNFGINIQLSIERQILGTGGGIKKAAYFFDDGRPFLVHNVDIITNVELTEFYQEHIDKNHLVTLAVKKRNTTRYFKVDQDNLICGHIDGKKNRVRIVKQPAGITQTFAFSGIHIISPQIFPHITEEGFFSIVDVYLKLIKMGYKIGVYRMDDCYWRDLGRIENVREVEADIKNGNYNGTKPGTKTRL